MISVPAGTFGRFVLRVPHQDKDERDDGGYQAVVFLREHLTGARPLDMRNVPAGTLVTTNDKTRGMFLQEHVGELRRDCCVLHHARNGITTLCG